MTDLKRSYLPSASSPPSIKSFEVDCRTRISRKLANLIEAALQRPWKAEEYSNNSYKPYNLHLSYAYNLVAALPSDNEEPHIILANLIDFNIYPLLKLSIDYDRVLVILLSFNDLAVSLFFNRGPRLAENANHKNRWIPLVPSKYMLETYPTMQRTREDYCVSSNT